MVAIARPDGQSAKGIVRRHTGRGDRRSAIIQAATELFAERGYAGVSIQEIADAAETHKTTVLYHFETKDALHEAVLDQALGLVAEVQREFLGGPFVRERVAYLIDQMHAFYAQHPALARLLERELLEPGGSEAYLRRFVDPIYVPAVAGFQRAVERGAIRAVDPALFIHDTHVTMIGYFCHEPLLRRLRPGVDPYSVDSLIARREYLVDQIFRQLAIDDHIPARAATSRRKKKEGGRSPA
jgi:TetR/AcrR family transcriptional regulator